MQFQIKATENLIKDKSKANVLVDNNLKEEIIFYCDSWTTVSIDISDVAPGQTFAVEIKNLSDDLKLDQASFFGQRTTFCNL